MKKDTVSNPGNREEFEKFIADKYNKPFFLSRNKEGKELVTFLVDVEEGAKLGIPDSITLPNGNEVLTDFSEGMAMPMGYIDTLSYQDCSEANADANKAKTRPIKGGSSIIPQSRLDEGKPGFGTLGLLVIDNDDNTLCALTNAHVTNIDPWLPQLVGQTPKAADQLSAHHVANHTIFQGAESAGYKTFDPETNDKIGIVKRYHPMGTMGSVDVSQTATPVWRGYGNVMTSNKGYEDGPKIMCDAALIALKESVVATDSWKQIGISSQGSSAPGWVTMAEYVQVMYDTDWGSHGSDVGGGAGRPKMFMSGRTTGPKEGDPEIEFAAPMQDFSIPYRSSVNSLGYNWARFSEAFSFGLKADAKSDEIFCNSPLEGGDSGSTIWVEINGVWKVLGLCFAGWMNSKTGKSQLGFAMPMPIVAQIMRISSWDGGLASSLFVDDSDEFTVETITKKGLGQVESYTVDGKTYYLGGTVLGSKSRAEVFEPTYQMDHRDYLGYTTNIVYNDWLSQANDTVGFEGRLYFNSTNNTLNGGNPVTQYTWTSRTGSYILSTILTAAEDSPYEGMSLDNTTEVAELLNTSGAYGLSGCDSNGDIANVPPVCLNGDPISWKSRHPSITDSSFRTGPNGKSYWSVGGAVTIPSEYKSFYISIPSQKKYEPIKVSYDDTANDGFDYSSILDLPGYIAALSPTDYKTASNAGNIAFDNIGRGSEIIPKTANLIFPIFNWEDIAARGLENKCARYCYDYTNQDPDWQRYIGYQMGLTQNPPQPWFQNTSLGNNAQGNTNIRYSSAHHEPTLIPLCMLSSKLDYGGSEGLTTGYQEWGYAAAGTNKAEQGGWMFNKMYGSIPTGNANVRGQMSEARGQVNYDWFDDPDNTSYAYNKNKGYMSMYYVINPKWQIGHQMWRDANGIPPDAELTTPYGHEFTCNSAGANGTKWDNAQIDKKLNKLDLLVSRHIVASHDTYYPRDQFNGRVDLSWVRNFTS